MNTFIGILVGLACLVYLMKNGKVLLVGVSVGLYFIVHMTVVIFVFLVKVLDEVLTRIVNLFK
jgi:hypothetical protein